MSLWNHGFRTFSCLTVLLSNTITNYVFGLPKTLKTSYVPYDMDPKICETAVYSQRIDYIYIRQAPNPKPEQKEIGTETHYLFSWISRLFRVTASAVTEKNCQDLTQSIYPYTNQCLQVYFLLIMSTWTQTASHEQHSIGHTKSTQNKNSIHRIKDTE